MINKKVVLMLGLCVWLTGCATSGNKPNDVPNTTAGMGERYLLGRGVPQDNKKAFTYFEQAAAEGDVFAQNELAYMYAAGKGTPRDNVKAFHWYKEAANHGLASAQYNLGLLYLYGIGTPQNKTQAIKWFKQSASYRFEPAMIALAKYQG